MTDRTRDTLSAFEQTGAYLQGHFRLTSGLHSPEYLQCAKVLQYPDHAERFGQQIFQQFQGPPFEGLRPDFICAPAMGGLIIGHEVARAFGVRFLFTERDAESKMTLRRGFAVTPGERTIIVEDVITTGGSTREVIELLRSMGVEVLAAASIIDRSGGTADVGVPRVALATLTAVTYPPETCPLCAQGLPVVKPGSRPA
ncbi:MAG: orotate phosphoribosyltransferase [Bryobacter sp.]|nr:orotate phosphoribosyltransferase [Bryobacter sp.]